MKTKSKKTAARNPAAPYTVGKKYLIRTVTMHLVGELSLVGDKELVLRDAAWIADSGRFSDALRTGNFNEVEPFVNPVIVGRGSVVDATEIAVSLPLQQK